MLAVLQGFPHPLHSAELILQLVSKVQSRAASGGDCVEPVMGCDAVTESSATVDCSLTDKTATYHVADDTSHSLLATVAEDVRQWALRHAYSSQWIEHFQSST